jgi:hypothetical protein
MKLKWRIAFGVAMFNDALDLAEVDSVPLIGDTIDIASSAVLWKILGRRYAAPTLLEIVPRLNRLPIYTATVTFAYYRTEKLGENPRLTA